MYKTCLFPFVHTYSLPDRYVKCREVQHRLLVLVRELGQYEGAVVGTERTVEVVEVVPLDARAAVPSLFPLPGDILLEVVLRVGEVLLFRVSLHIHELVRRLQYRLTT